MRPFALAAAAALALLWTGGALAADYTIVIDKMAFGAVPEILHPGDTITLPDGLGTVTFAGYQQWAAFQINHDPGKQVVLVAVSFMVLGLLFSLRVRRRRLWVRASADPAGRTLVEVGGLTRTDASGGFDDEFARLVAALRSSIAPLAGVDADDRSAVVNDSAALNDRED